MDPVKILIVEDNTTVAKDCRDCLESLGYCVTSIVASGEESIQRAEAERPDAILMDIRLRDEMDGIEAAEQIHARFEIPVVFLSAYTDRELLERAKRVGSFGYLLKPFDERELHATLEMALYKAKAEKERRQMEARLQQTQKIEAISTLAGGIAHEFNNALMSILGNIELLKMDLPENERTDKSLEAMKDSGHRMSRLTDQLLAYAQGGKYQSEHLKLTDFVIETMPILQHDLGPTVRVETHFKKDISYVKADHAQMQIALSAILANSNEAMENEGIINITAGNEDLDENFTEQHPGLKPGSYVCLTVEDEGKGMNEEEREKIFEPFFTTKFQGRGMGMAAVYGIVKNHDGWISVDSELGKGTVVRIYLPAIEAKEEVKKEVGPKPTVELATGEGTILVIEDEEPLVELFRQVLEMLGYRVLEARTGKEAVEFAKTFDGQIDLALLDIKLPDMDGGRVYPLIMEARPDLKVIVCSGYSIHGPAQDILDAGAEGFIQKPFSIVPFAEKLKEVLEGK